MADEAEYTNGSLGTEVAPASRPRDQGGKFIREAVAPASFLAPRSVEGDPDTGDTSDAGEDPRYRSIERDLADGREEQAGRKAGQKGRADGERRRANGPQRNDADADDGHELLDEEPEHLAPVSEPDADEGKDGQDDEGPRYAVVVDGEEREVSLNEALAGYIRQETFHKRMTDLGTIQGRMEEDATRLQNGWKAWSVARDAYEQDLRALIPQEPNWDEMAKVNPGAVIEQQKVYRTLYQKLADSRAAREAQSVKDAEEADRRLAKYAIDGQNAFYTKHAKLFPNREEYDKNIQSMKRTAVDAGFTDQETATVFDPRMLTVLLWASKFRRMMAARVRAVDPSNGRTVPAGSATPRNGNVNRRGRDEAASRLQKEGSLDAAAEYFRRVL